MNWGKRDNLSVVLVPDDDCLVVLTPWIIEPPLLESLKVLFDFIASYFVITVDQGIFYSFLRVVRL